MPIEEAVPGRVVEYAGGACYVSELRRGAHETHAGEVIGEARDVSTLSLSELTGNASLADMDPGSAAYLDTETTGLAGSSGTYAFLVGVGRFQGDSFVVRQLFMRSPVDEPAQLSALEEWLDGCTSLVTFNGRAYDVPLLDGRFRLHRRPWRGWAEWPHLDLLPAARRLWGRRLEGCALTDLERRIFGTTRHEDVPGWLVPERYFRYQRDGDARGLVSVFRHNALDILTMASLLTRVARTFSDPESWVRHGVDWMSLGAVYERARDPERALSAWGQALSERLSPGDVRESEWRMALAAKRCGDWERAAELWTSLIKHGPSHAGPYVELAKMHEHQAREYDAALGFARAARDLVAAGRLERHRRSEALAELDHRIKRLEARASNKEAAPPQGQGRQD
jgi:hypothetical protein